LIHIVTKTPLKSAHIARILSGTEYAASFRAG
jgi:hypothetical protein